MKRINKEIEKEGMQRKPGDEEEGEGEKSSKLGSRKLCDQKGRKRTVKARRGNKSLESRRREDMKLQFMDY